MNCPEHNKEITLCKCPIADDIMEMSGKQLSDGHEPAYADMLALSEWMGKKYPQMELI